jgi:hypothetical protein
MYRAVGDGFSERCTKKKNGKETTELAPENEPEFRAVDTTFCLV